MTSSPSDPPRPENRTEAFQRMMEDFRAEDGHHNPPAYQAYLNRLLGPIDLRGKRVLEIGSGRGLISLHCAVSGAAAVVSVEPEMEGSTAGVIATQVHRIKSLGLTNVELCRADFNELNFSDESFDVIVMIAVLNHLYETPLNARSHKDVFDTYTAIAKKLYGLLDTGGVVIATDACRYSLWTQARRMGYPRNWCLSQRTINWRIHQQPTVWKKIFEEAGFSRVDITYPVPYRLRSLGKVVASAPVNFALMGEFILHAQR